VAGLAIVATIFTVSRRGLLPGLIAAVALGIAAAVLIQRPAPSVDAGRLSWRPLSLWRGFGLVLIGQNLLIEFQLLNQPLDFLDADIARHNQPEACFFCQHPGRQFSLARHEFHHLWGYSAPLADWAPVGAVADQLARPQQGASTSLGYWPVLTLSGLS
jgi:hypothetical protein